MGDDHSFPSIIKKLMSDKKFYASAVKQAGKIAERFDSAAGGEKLVHIYREVLSSKS